MLHSTGDLENTLNKKSQTETVTYFNYLTYMNCQEKVYLKKNQKLDYSRQTPCRV